MAEQGRDENVKVEILYSMGTHKYRLVIQHNALMQRPAKRSLCNNTLRNQQTPNAMLKASLLSGNGG
jgi:hypothetical protein